MSAEVALTGQQLPESLQALKRAARARAEAARRQAEEKEAAAAAAAARLLLDALTADLPPDLAPYLAPVDGAEAGDAVQGSRDYVAELRVPGHRRLFARYQFHGGADAWRRAEFGRQPPHDHATAPSHQPRQLWRVDFESERAARYYHDLGAALAAAETDDPNEWAVRPAPDPTDVPF